MSSIWRMMSMMLAPASVSRTPRWSRWKIFTPSSVSRLLMIYPRLGWVYPKILPARVSVPHSAVTMMGRYLPMLLPLFLVCGDRRLSFFYLL